MRIDKSPITERAKAAISALKEPDASLARVPNVVRQSIREVIEEILSQLVVEHEITRNLTWQIERNNENLSAMEGLLERCVGFEPQLDFEIAAVIRSAKPPK